MLEFPPVCNHAARPETQPAGPGHEAPARRRCAVTWPRGQQESSKLCSLWCRDAILTPIVEKIRIGLGRGEVRMRALLDDHRTRVGAELPQAPPSKASSLSKADYALMSLAMGGASDESPLKLGDASRIDSNDFYTIGTMDGLRGPF